MGLTEFLQQIPVGNTKPVPYAALPELSGLTDAEARMLAERLTAWDHPITRDLLSRLHGLSDEEPSVEFESVFKAFLASPDSKVRRISVHALGESSDRTLAAHFARLLLNDPDPDVRTATAVAMSNLSLSAAGGKLHATDAARLRSALFRAASDAGGEVELRRRSLESLAVFKGDDVSALIEQIYGTGDSLLRKSAIYAMGKSADRRWLKMVTSQLDSVDAAMRYEAVTALGELGAEAHVPALRVALDDTDLEVQVAAVGALEKIGGEQARLLLFRSSKSAEPQVAAAAREALAAIAEDDKLSEVITPEMAASGLFGGGTSPDKAEVASDTDEEDEAYDAPQREGWSWLADDREAEDGESEVETPT